MLARTADAFAGEPKKPSYLLYGTHKKLSHVEVHSVKLWPQLYLADAAVASRALRTASSERRLAVRITDSMLKKFHLVLVLTTSVHLVSGGELILKHGSFPQVHASPQPVVIAKLSKALGHKVAFSSSVMVQTPDEDAVFFFFWILLP